MRDQAEGLRQMVKDENLKRSKELNLSRPGKQQIICVASGKGGVGKTNFCVNLAIALANKNQRVLLMDVDLGLGNINLVMGETTPFNLYHVFKGEKDLAEIVFKTKYKVDIISGGNGFAELANMSEVERLDFIEQLSLLNFYDIILLDTGAGISSNVTSFLLAADKCIIVTTPEPTSVTDAYGIIKVLSKNEKKENIELVINRCENARQGKYIAEKIKNIASDYLDLEIKSLGMVFQDEQVSRSVLSRKPFIIKNPRGESSLCIESIANKLLNLPYKDKKVESVFKTVFKKFWINK